VVLVNDAKDVARQWVSEQGSLMPGFTGAFFHGSVNWAGDDATLPATSDVDVMVVVDDPDQPPKPGKFRYRDVLLEVSFLPAGQLRSSEQVLGSYNLAGSFRAPSIILDPSGSLTALQAAVARDYAKRRWVRQRCANARDKILNGYGWSAADPWHDQVVSWLFPAGITTHVLLVAGLKNPTVRQRYVATRELLAEYGLSPFYDELLELLGCATMSQERAMQHLAALTEAFDAAKGVIRSPFFFASDISDVGRPLAIDGTRELIARGDHREAVFWMLATYSRCQKVFHHDAPRMETRFGCGYGELLAGLGIRSSADLPRRLVEVRRCVPQVWQVAEAIMAANPSIEDERVAPDTPVADGLTASARGASKGASGE
jgi:hypothetical protein